MGLKKIVKVSHIANLSDARYCAGMGVQLLGFCPEENTTGYIDSKTYFEITSWIKGITLVGEFYHSDSQKIREKLNTYKFDLIQFNKPDLTGYLQTLSVPLIFHLTIDQDDNLTDKTFVLKDLKNRVQYFLIDGEVNETSQLDFLLELSQHFPLLLGCGISASNIQSISRHPYLTGIALHGGNEIRPGYKDYQDLADILEQMEMVD